MIACSIISKQASFFLKAKDQSRPSLSTFRPLFNNLLFFRLNCLIIDFPRGLALLPLRGLRRLNADGRCASAPNLLLGLFPGSVTVVYLVSGGWKSVIVHSLFNNALHWQAPGGRRGGEEKGKGEPKLTCQGEGHRSKPFAFRAVHHSPALHPREAHLPARHPMARSVHRRPLHGRRLFPGRLAPARKEGYPQQHPRPEHGSKSTSSA